MSKLIIEFFLYKQIIKGDVFGCPSNSTMRGLHTSSADQVVVHPEEFLHYGLMGPPGSSYLADLTYTLVITGTMI